MADKFAEKAEAVGEGFGCETFTDLDAMLVCDDIVSDVDGHRLPLQKE